MICLAPSPPEDEALAGLAEAVVRMCGRPVLRMERWPGGGNNRLYRMHTSAGLMALKEYGPAATDPKGDRLHREFAALSFLARHGVTDVPAPVAADRVERLGLYDWIDGVPVARTPEGRCDADIVALADFALGIQDLRTAEGAAAVAPAAEACLSTAELLRQVENRLAALSGLRDEPGLAAFLANECAPTLAIAEQRAHDIHRTIGLAPDSPLHLTAMVLSPSDFGFHNSLRRPDGRLVFLDFEYFGWDDPVKLLADTLWHPAHLLSPAEQRSWLDLLGTPLANRDPTLEARLRAQMPLYGLRWCVILLNEFLSDRWHRRLKAGTSLDWPAAKAIQLTKARIWLTETRRLLAQPAWVPIVDTAPLHLASSSPSGSDHG